MTIIVAARLDALPEVLILVSAGQKDDGRPTAGFGGPHLAGHPIAVMPGHFHIKQDQIGLFLLEQGEGQIGGVGLQDLVSGRIQLCSQNAAGGDLVIDHQDPQCGQRGGLLQVV